MKIKQVKQLCYEQLKNMASEEMKKVIMGEAQQLKEEEEEEEEEERQIGVKEILELTKELDDPSEKREAASSCSNSSGELSCSRMEGDSMTERLSSAKLVSRDEECELRVSDVSEGESSEGDGDLGEAGGSVRTPCSPQDTFSPEAPMGARETPSPSPLEDRIELTADSPNGDLNKELHEEQAIEGACKEQDGLSLESSQATEMMLRQRALEAVLRRRSSTFRDSEGYAEQQDESHSAEDEEEEEERNRESRSPESPESDELEQILRQKALQSMLSKRKTSQNKHDISSV